MDDDTKAEDPIAALEGKILKLRIAKDKAVKDVQAAQRRAADADRALSDALSELGRLRPPMTDAERRRQVAARTQEERRRRVENQQLSPYASAGGGRSRIDAALNARRIGYGYSRPSYPVIK